MTTHTPDPLAAIKARLAKATPGPWTFTQPAGNIYQLPKGPFPTSDEHPIGTMNNVVDSEFVAHAPTDLAFLLARVEALTKERDELKLANTNANGHLAELSDQLAAATTRYNECEGTVNLHMKECAVQEVAKLQAALTRAEQERDEETLLAVSAQNEAERLANERDKLQSKLARAEAVVEAAEKVMGGEGDAILKLDEAITAWKNSK